MVTKVHLQNDLQENLQEAQQITKDLQTNEARRNKLMRLIDEYQKIYDDKIRDSKRKELVKILPIIKTHIGYAKKGLKIFHKEKKTVENNVKHLQNCQKQNNQVSRYLKKQLNNLKGETND